ncbi:MAG: universal stress protein, partial [Deltaproteobacteria bacterium]|nr:universal stress protein [Deltaproteobacteria bacterium]
MLENFKRILVTTDFSESGDRAILHAFRMAADHGAEVVLCHVVEPIVVANPLYLQYYPGDLLSPDIRQRAEADAHVALEGLVPKDGALVNVTHRTYVAHGSPAEEVIRVAEQQQIDLIVIATHGHTGLKHLFMGSVAERV